jgi:hypothetical protein
MFPAAGLVSAAQLLWQWVLLSIPCTVVTTHVRPVVALCMHKAPLPACICMYWHVPLQLQAHAFAVCSICANESIQS